MTDDLTVTADDAVVLYERNQPGVPDDGRNIILRLVRWNETANTPQGRETFQRGAFADVDPARVVIESQRHDGGIVGRGVAIEDAEDGAYLQARISDTTEGNDLLTLVRDQVMNAVSVVFRPIQSSRLPDGTHVRERADLQRAAILPRGAYPSAQILEVRNETMTEATTEAQAAVAPAPAPALDLSPVNGRLDSLDAAIAEVRAAQAIPQATSQDHGLLARYDSFGQAMLAATSDPEVNQALQRALADNTTATSPGHVAAGHYIGRVIGPAQAIRKSINAFGGAYPLPAAGMSFEWLAYMADSTFAVDEQVAEKDEIATGTSKWEQKTAPVRTFSGGSDNALQLIERSSPSFLESLARHYADTWAARTNQAFVAILAASATTDALSMTGADADADMKALRSKLFGQSIAIESESGRPADVVLAASDVFQRIGESSQDNAQAVQNVDGVGNAATLNVSVSGLRIVHEPALGAGKMVTSVNGAAGWHEDGPKTIEAANVAQLGRDVAVYSFGNGALFREAAVIVTTVTLA